MKKESKTSRAVISALVASCLYATMANRLRKITDVTTLSNAGCLQ